MSDAYACRREVPFGFVNVVTVYEFSAEEARRGQKAGEIDTES